MWTDGCACNFAKYASKCLGERCAKSDPDWVHRHERSFGLPRV
jgi:hypothetical protein